MHPSEMERIKRALNSTLHTIEDIDAIAQYLVSVKQNMLHQGIRCHHCQSLVSHNQVWIEPYKNERTPRKIFCLACVEKIEKGITQKCASNDCANVVFTHTFNGQVYCTSCNDKNYGKRCIYCQQKRSQYHFFNPYSPCEKELTIICDSCFTQRGFTDTLILKERKRVKIHNNRALALSLPATLTLCEWLFTLENFNWKCAYCGGSYQVLEHFIPLARKGTTKSNCVPSCARCNTTKNSSLPEHVTFLSPTIILGIKNYLQQFS